MMMTQVALINSSIMQPSFPAQYHCVSIKKTMLIVSECFINIVGVNVYATFSYAMCMSLQSQLFSKATVCLAIVIFFIKEFTFVTLHTAPT